MRQEDSRQDHDHVHVIQAKEAEQPGDALIDPVCGMAVAPASRHLSDVGVVQYHFCSAGCKTKFDADPQRYRQPGGQEAPSPQAEYTCPMHPEVRQIGPGLSA